MSYSIQHWNRDRQRGQVTLWFLAMMAACCAMLALVYNVSHVTNEKEATINAADAAAVSGALVEARMLNFDAYANRAIVANEVTIAQLISAKSFVAYNSTMAQWASFYSSFIPIVGPEISALINDYKFFIDKGNDFIHEALGEVIPLIDNFVIGGLKTAQKLVTVVAPAAANNVANSVAEANSTKVDTALKIAALTSNIKSWSAFVTTEDSRKDARDMVMWSFDKFTSNRRGPGRAIQTLNDTLDRFSIYFVPYAVLDKTSGSTQLSGYDTMIAQDSMDVAASVKYRGDFSLRRPLGRDKYWRENLFDIRWAYGRAEATKNGSRDYSAVCMPHYLSGYQANCGYANMSGQSYKWKGIPEILKLKAAPDKTLHFVFGVQKAGSETSTTQRLKLSATMPGSSPLGSPSLDDNFANQDRLISLARAEVYFERPGWRSGDSTAGSLRRPGGVREYASLYNPYWQARLKQTDRDTRLFFYGVNAAVHGLDTKLLALLAMDLP